MYDEDEDDEDEQQAKKDSVVETKKENKRKEKGLKALLNDNASNTKKITHIKIRNHIIQIIITNQTNIKIMNMNQKNFITVEEII